MSQTSPLSLQDHFERVDDPRVERTREYELLDMIVIGVCGHVRCR
jgi:hypothetical protein